MKKLLAISFSVCVRPSFTPLEQNSYSLTAIVVWPAHSPFVVLGCVCFRVRLEDVSRVSDQLFVFFDSASASIDCDLVEKNKQTNKQTPIGKSTTNVNCRSRAENIAASTVSQVADKLAVAARKSPF